MSVVTIRAASRGDSDSKPQQICCRCLRRDIDDDELPAMNWKGNILRKRRGGVNLETALLQAHVKLRLASKSADEPVTATLARHGSYEVRLFEPPHDFLPGDFLFWIELFDHDSQVSMDSCGAYILEDAVVSAQFLIARAKQFSEPSGRA